MSAPSSDSDDFELIDHQEVSLTPDSLTEIEAWLQPTDYNADSSEFKRHLSSRAAGTGLWVAETPRFGQWHDSHDHGSLWIKGVPGAGKSVIAASMIEYLKSIDNAPVLFFFFRYIIVANRTPRSLIRDWLAQLLPYSSRLQVLLQSLITSELEDVSDEQLWENLWIGLSSVEKAYCVVDALDEMEPASDDGFLPRLNDLATFRPDNVKLLMTSRPKQYLQSSLKEASIVHISLEQDLVGKDITAFVRHRLSTPLSDQENLLDSLVSTICERSRGLFLYARLILDQIIPIIRSSSHLDVEKLANTLPIGLEEMYSSMLSQQAKVLEIETSIQVFLLECITHSSRALRLNELANALSHEFVALPATPKEIARSACAPLLEILEDETVQVIHHSFTEFLLDFEQVDLPTRSIRRQFPVLDPSMVHRKLAMTCLNYLQSGVLRPMVEEEESASKMSACECGDSDDCTCPEKTPDTYDYQEARLRYPFLEYAVTKWAYHASHYDVDDEGFFQSITNFVRPGSRDFERWVSLEWTTRSPALNQQMPSPMHIAGFAGLTKYAATLLNNGQSVDSLDSDGRTPLWWAARRNHVKIVPLLLQNGASPDKDENRGVKPIHEAAKKNHATIVQLLLEAGVDPLTPKTGENHTGRLLGGEKSTKGETAVQYVCRQGHTETILVMLPFIQPQTSIEMLCQCCRYGKVEAVRAVLEHSNIPPNSKFWGATALYLATQAQSIKCVEMLLARGADVHTTSEWTPRDGLGPRRSNQGRIEKPINILARVWKDSNHIACQSILGQLLGAGADLEYQDGAGETPLLSAIPAQATPSHMAVKALLEAGANISVIDRMGNNVLHRLLQAHRDVQMLELLIKHGANLEARGYHGNTVLHLTLTPPSSTYGPDNLDDVIAFLLNNGARSLCSVKNDSGRTALEAAAHSRDCSIGTFKLLLDACSDEAARRRCLWALGFRKSKEETAQFVQAIVAAGVPLDSRDGNGRTALLSSTRSPDLFQVLLDCGAQLEAVDSSGRGALHHYIFISGSSAERLRNMVNMGLDPHKVDNDANTILHGAAGWYMGTTPHVQIIQQIIDFGISVNAKNALGLTPLHVHFEGNRVLSSDHQHTQEHFLALLRRCDASLDVNAQDSDGLTSLHLAAMRCEINVARLLAAGADVSNLTKNKRTPLHLACRARRSDTVRLLLNETSDRELILGRLDSFGRTALHDACTSGRPESVYYLLKYGADVTVKDLKGRTPLHSCAEFVIEQKLWSLLEHSDEAAWHSSKDRYRPGAARPYANQPWYACAWQHMPPFTEHDTARVGEIITMLTAAGADIAARDSDHLTPLDLALIYDCKEMVNVLKSETTQLQQSWKIETVDGRLQTAVALNYRPSLVARHVPEVPLQEILRYPQRYLSFLGREDIDWIAKNGGNITGSQTNYSDSSLLQIVAERGLTEIMEDFGDLAQIFDDPLSVRDLVDQCAKARQYPSYVSPVLHWACKRELPNIQMLVVLVNHCQVNVNARALVSSCPPYGRDLVPGPTALHQLAKAQFGWHLDAIRFLIQKGAYIDSKNEKGETPLHVASRGNTSHPMGMGKELRFWRPSCVEILLDLGADPNTLDDSGLSPLHKASSAPEIMKILLHRGADLSAGKSNVLFSAIMGQDLNTLTIILDGGASANSIDTARSCQVHYKVKGQERFALFCACFPPPFNGNIKDSVSLVKLLIERGADLYAPLNDADTLTHYVFEKAEYPIVCAFLDYSDKIDFTTKDPAGRTVLLAACDWGECLPGYRHQHWDPKARGPVMRLLDLGADSMAVDNEGRNALHHLLDNPDIEHDTILQFLDHEASKPLLHQMDGKGFLPLHCALRILRPPACESLMALGANLLEPDPRGVTALHYIAAQYLRFHEPKINATLQRDHPPEYYEGCLRLWQKFLDLGGNVNIGDNLGSPPLFSYLSSPQTDDYRAKEDQCCHVENFAKFFADADLNIRNGEGETALHIIARREKTFHTKAAHDRTLFEFMVAKGLDPLAEDARGRSSLDVAAACGKSEILDLFQYRS